MARIAAGLLLALALPAVAAADDDAFARHQKGIQAAHAAKDWPAMLEHAKAVAGLAPASTRAQYNLACALALNGRAEEAVKTLDRQAARGVFMDVLADEDFASLRERPDFQAVVAKFKTLNEPLGRATPALRLDEKDLLTEGVAHDAKSGDFFVSSVHRRKIVRVAADGKARDFATGLDSVLGMAVDAPRRRLWACTMATPQMQGYRPEDKGRAAAVAFDLDNGREALRLTVPGEGRRTCDGLAVAGDGTLFVADPGEKRVLTAAPGAKELTVFVPPGSLESPQGLALSADGKALYVADYAQGLARVDRATGKVVVLEAAADGPALGGIDGLARHGDTLIAIQNGLRPHRVLRLRVDGDRIAAVEVLERSHAAFDEPTLGVVAGDAFYFVGNSQWGSFPEGKPVATDKLQPPVILRLALR